MRSKSIEKFTPFSALNTTQFMGALNDNLYKLFLIYFLIQLQGENQSDRILSIAGMVFVIPFLLFSAMGGTLADRYSKRRVILFTKVCEVVAIGAGLLSFYTHLTWLGYGALFVMGLQSAIFGPSKYGIIPEIVPSYRISRANGLVSSFTYFAIILGTFLASLLTQLTQRNILLASSFCVLVAIVGLATSLYIPKTGTGGSQKKISLNFLSEVYQTLKRCRYQDQMLVVILCGSFFLFAGGFVQLNIIPYAIDVLGLPDIGGGYLFLLVALGIGLGSLLAGRFSGKKVELGLVPLGLFGIFFFLLALGIGFHSITLNALFLFFLGVSGGIYLVPLDSYIQTTSNDSERGQNVAANNFMGFVGVLFASALLYLFGHLLDLSAEKSFQVTALVAFLFTLIIFRFMGDYCIKFVAENVLRARYRIVIVEGKSMCEQQDPQTLFLFPRKLLSHRLFLYAVFPQPVRIVFLQNKTKGWKKWVLRWFGNHYFSDHPQDIDKLKKTIARGQKRQRPYCIIGKPQAAKELALALGCQIVDVELEITPKGGRRTAAFRFSPHARSYSVA